LVSRDAQELSDTQLVERIGNGDSPAFAAFYDRFGGIVFGIALRILRSRAEAEEALGEVFLEVWRRAATVDPRRAPLPWLTLLARSRSLDRLRAGAVRARVVGESASEPAPPPTDGDREVALRGECLVARRALEQLSADQRTVLTLAYFEGLTQSEIADRLGSPLETVKTQTSLGLRRLGELLANGLGP